MDVKKEYAIGDRVIYGLSGSGTVVEPEDDAPDHVWVVLDDDRHRRPAWTTADCLRPLIRCASHDVELEYAPRTPPGLNPWRCRACNPETFAPAAEPADGISHLPVDEQEAILKHREERARRERADARFAAWAVGRLAFWEDTTWRQADGVERDVSDMTPNHARNSARIARGLWQRESRIIDQWLMEHRGPDIELPVFYGDPPLVEALDARGRDRETWLDRRADRRHRKAWQRLKAERRHVPSGIDPDWDDLQ